ncbi:MAG TPA: VCBS repeat-containing protein [Verrucomicrobiae bacterium]|nr:VCBS repeat-containing protein [Verrucomicrobiae bacterium]
MRHVALCMFNRNVAVRFGSLVVAHLLLHEASASDLTNRFGFSGPEIFPIENQITQAKCADIDGDGLNDLVVVNNARSKITLLFNQTGKTNDPVLLQERERRDINELPPDARFRMESIASEKRISSLVVTDLNHDDKPDIAYYGEPKELIIQYNEGTNKWSALKRFPIEDGTLDPYALVSGDLNGDGRTDLLLLADAFIYFITQKQDGTLAEPEKIPYVGSVKSIQVLDIQGDNRDDLLLVNWDNLNPFRFRLQNNSGKLGPEMHFTLPPIRSYWADDLDGDHRTEIVTIAQKSGRAQISTFRAKPAEELSGSWKLGQFQIMPLAKTTKTRRGMLWADLNGDGRSDLLVAEPESGQLALSVQLEDGSFESPRTFATLTGITDLAAADWDNDGKSDVFTLSSDERQVGVTSLDEKGRLGFPKVIVMEGRPLVIASGTLKFGDRPALATIVDLDGKRELQIQTAAGKPFRQKLSESFKANPTAMLVHDADQDGLLDLVVLMPYEKVKILLQVREGDFKEIDVAPPGGNTDQPWVSTADVDGDGKDELLLPQRNFLRAVVLKSIESGPWNFEVKEQINAAASNSRIVAAASLQQDKKKVPALFLLDTERKALTLSERNESGVWEITRSISLPYTDFQAVRPIMGAGRQPGAVSLMGINAIGWLQLKGEVWEFVELDGYETPIKDGFLHDVVSGDLNGDQRKDLVFLETGKSYLDLVTFEEPHKLVPANRWQVFEERTFRSRRNELPEPREALIADLTGDGKNDLVVIVHDRVLLYPQD